MSDRMAIAQYCIDALLKAGVQKTQCRLDDTTRQELNAESGEISLLRTTTELTLTLTGIIDDKKGSVSINKTDTASIDSAVESVLEQAESSEPDIANDIAEKQPTRNFQRGPEKADLDLMYDRLKAYLDYSRRTYPKLIQGEVILDFVSKASYFVNSNGVKFASRSGIYGFLAIFTSKEGKKTSSINCSVCSGQNLDKELQQWGSIDTLLKQSSEQTTTQTIPQKIVGDVIITPDCMKSFIAFITDLIRNHAMITGTSIFKDKLNETIADSQLTLHSKPISAEAADGYFFTKDGYEAQNSTIIDRGVLKGFLLDLYGSKKTGMPKAVNDGQAYVIDAGEHSYQDLIGSVKKGILLCRFSGNNPSVNGDFTGVAKNSYYIENGQVQYPLSETMISGNFGTLLKNIRHISRERIDFGSDIFPWIQFSDITISGK